MSDKEKLDRAVAQFAKNLAAVNAREQTRDTRIIKPKSRTMYIIVRDRK